MQSLAVATGRFNADTLRAHDPDAVVDTLADDTYLRAFLDS
jgi:hypothetical protein